MNGGRMLMTMNRFDLIYDEHRMDTVFLDTKTDTILTEDKVLEMLNDLNSTVNKLNCRLKRRDKKIHELGVKLRENYKEEQKGE